MAGSGSNDNLFRRVVIFQGTRIALHFFMKQFCDRGNSSATPGLSRFNFYLVYQSGTVVIFELRSEAMLLDQQTIRDTLQHLKYDELEHHHSADESAALGDSNPFLLFPLIGKVPDHRDHRCCFFCDAGIVALSPKT